MSEVLCFNESASHSEAEKQTTGQRRLNMTKEPL